MIQLIDIDALAEGRKNQPLQRLYRFMQRVEIDEASGCWLWKGNYSGGSPYGKFHYREGGKVITKWAHRFAYESLIGPVPDGLVLDHWRCDNPACVSPMHVRPVTSRENTLRSLTAIAAVNARKTHCDNGHEFTPENTYSPSKRPNERHCRSCRNERTRQWRNRQRNQSA